MKPRVLDQSNRRQAERRETSLKARIAYGPGQSVTLNCTIRNLNSGGALIDLPEDRLLPPTFRLFNVAEGFAYDAKIAWRRGRQLGVVFSRIEDLRAGGAAGALRAVWKTLARG